MDKEKIYNFYEKVYFNDLAEMNTILSRFPILIAGVALIINAYVFLFNFDVFVWLPRLVITFIMAVISFSVSRLLYCLFKTFKVQAYKMVSSIPELEEYRESLLQYEKDLIDFNQEHPDHKQDLPDLDNLFRENLINNFMECSKENNIRSEIRRAWFHKSMRWIWINLCLCITIPISTIVITLWI